MKLVDWLTIAGLVLGPSIAVLISLWIEDRRQIFARRISAVRTLLIGRLNAADPSFQLAMNTIPIDFADDDRVLAAYEAYMDAVTSPLPDDLAARAPIFDRWGQLLSDLVHALLVSVGYNERRAAKLARSRYISTASGDQYVLQQNALQAVIELAKNTGRMADMNERLVMHLAQVPPPAAEPPAESQPKA